MAHCDPFISYVSELACRAGSKSLLPEKLKQGPTADYRVGRAAHTQPELSGHVKESAGQPFRLQWYNLNCDAGNV